MPKSPDANPVYRYLKNQRDSTNILQFILGSFASPTKPKQKRMYNQTKLKLTQRQNKINHIKSFKERQNFQLINKNIIIGTEKIAEEMRTNKKRINILDEFNKKVENYYTFVT